MDIKEAVILLGGYFDSLYYSGCLDYAEKAKLNEIESTIYEYVRSKGDIE